jgi:pimeloyl-ACP methyl ester carboxylesterase
MDRRDVLMSAASAVAGAGLAATGGTARAETGGSTHARDAFVEAKDGTRLFIRDWGRGKPVLFVHAWALNADQWDYQAAFLLDRDFRCISYDTRGHSRSGQPGHGYDYDTLADDLGSVIETLDLHDVTLVGHSMGCSEIIRYLTRHGSGRVSRVVLLAPMTPLLLKTADNPEGIDASMFEAVRATWRKDFPKWLADNADPFFVPETSPGMKDWVLHMMYRTPLPVLIECNKAVVGTDFRAELTKIDVPVLLIQGDKDASAPLPLTGQRTAALIPGVVFKVYEGAPHGLFVTHMERVNEDILAFIEA